MKPSPLPSGRDAQRRAVLDAASRILSAEGDAALSTRRVAKEAGASTMVLYSLFASKEGLVDALLAEGFRRFAVELQRVRDPDPWRHLDQLGHAYRRFALANPTYFRLMWRERACPVPKNLEHRAAVAEGQTAFATFLEGVRGVMVALDRPAREIEPAAVQAWSAVHGFVSLELAGVFAGHPSMEPAYAQLLEFISRGLGKPAQAPRR